jgi:hypothetical protein
LEGRLVEISEADIERIAKDAAKKAIKEVMTTWGVDVKNPLEMQEDFAWTRKYRKLAENIGSGIILTVVTLSTIGIVALITKSIWHSGGDIKP